MPSPVQLTVAKLAILIKYGWQEVGFLALASAEEKVLMAGIDWPAMDELLQDLKRYHHRLVSPAYAQKIHLELLAHCADEATAQTLIGYASTL